MRPRSWLFIIAIVAMGLPLATPRAWADDHVQATLLADVKQIVPGKSFHLGILVNIDPGWHIYWLNPGDSGLATKIELRLPNGLSAQEVQFPTPRRIQDPGNIDVFGYTDKVMFIATVTPDAKLPPGNAHLSATVKYLVCKDNCIPGHATVGSELPIASAGAKAAVDNTKLFDEWIMQLPLKPKDFPDARFSQAIDQEKNSVSLDFWVLAGSTNPDIFPGANEDVDVVVKQRVGKTDAGRSAEHFTLTIRPLAGHAMPRAKLPLVIGWTERRGTHRGLITEIDLSKLQSADSKPPHS